MLPIVWCFLLLLFGYSASAQDTRCFPLAEGGSLCFTQPVPPVALPWSNALQWCKNIGATLPITGNTYHTTIYGNAVDYFGLGTQTLWLGANSTYNLNDWYWAGGVRFAGTIEERNVAGKSHAYIRRDGTNFKFVADDPWWEIHYFICMVPHSEVLCASTSNSYWTGGKCYIKNIYETTWYNAWYSCGEAGGVIAVIDNVNDFSRWLDDSQPFWVDLRSTWWTWHDAVTGTSFEVTENLFGEIYPDGNSAECLASYKDQLLDLYQWINQNCNNNLQFICQQYVHPTTTGPSTTKTNPLTSATTTIPPTSPTTIPPTSPTTIPPTSATTITATSITETITNTSRITTITPYVSTNPTNPTTTTASEGNTATAGNQNASTTSSGKSNSNSNSANYALPFGLAVGIGGALIVGVIVWVSLLTAYAYKEIGISRFMKVFPQ